MVEIKMTRAEFAAAQQKVSAQLGEPVTEDSGLLEHDGAKVRYDFDGATLTVQVVSKPFFVSMGYVEIQIHTWFASQ